MNRTPKLIDTHCHLDAAEFDADRTEVMRDARLAGVDTVIVPAVEVANFAAVIGLSAAESGCCYALGIHPMYVDRAADDALDALRSALVERHDDPALVAVGEIGLDHFVPGLDRERQARFLRAQLKLAREFELPVILHVRQAQDLVLKHLREARVAGGIAHAFNGSTQQARAFTELGFALGFGGAMTFERALRIRGLARELPAQALVLETDAPDIPPAWLRRTRNEPRELSRIAPVLAELRGLSIAEIAQITTENACRVLPRLAARLEARRSHL